MINIREQLLKSIYLKWLAIVVVLIVGWVAVNWVISNVHASSDDETCTQQNANNPKNCPDPSPVCHNGEHTGNPHCSPKPTPTINPCLIWDEVCPTPSASPSASPSATPTVSPSTTPLPSPTSSPSASPTEEPTPSATPSPSSTPEPSGTPQPSESPSPSETPAPQTSNGGGLAEAPAWVAPTCSQIQFTPTVTSFNRLSPTSVQIGWTTVDSFVTNYMVWYGITDQANNWNVVVNGNSTTLNDLPANLSIWVRVAGTDQGCVGNFSQIVDP